MTCIKSAVSPRHGLVGALCLSLLFLVSAAGCSSSDSPSGVGGGVCTDCPPDSGLGSVDGGSTAEDGGSAAPDAEPVSCTRDEDCDDGNICNGIETCSEDNVCQAGTPPTEPTPCGDGMMCAEGECVIASCGNGIIEGAEQCDDGNLEDFDGCDSSCRYEFFVRAYEMELMPSPAGSFCHRPTSALGDALHSLALAEDNADRQERIDLGLENSLTQFVGLRDLSGTSNEIIEVRRATGVLDPARGTWPADGSSPIDWSFLLDAKSVTSDGRIADRLEQASVTEGVVTGGGGTSLRDVPEYLDWALRGRFDYSSDPDVPSLPEGGLADGLVVPRGFLADGEDEGACGTLTVDFLASIPATPAVEDCLECPGQSRTYTACPGDEVTESCNSVLDTLVGGCIAGFSCAAGMQAIIPTQPDVDHGGAGPLEADSNNLHKIPRSQTDANPNGYSTYFRFRANRVHVTGSL